MPLFPASFIDDLKSHADLVQVVQERVALRRSGATWKGLCPFHGEKTPSFHVNGDKGFFHCFGCGAGGDAFKFLELHEKIGFQDAVKQLAQRFGVALPEPGCHGTQTGTFAGGSGPYGKPAGVDAWRTRFRGSSTASIESTG